MACDLRLRQIQGFSYGVSCHRGGAVPKCEPMIGW
ncbi:hypothetical protein STAN_6620 [Streptomyces sp. CBMAI 2042]|nr:hypothetical protein STAN_6620 [Streptomyces sp. CBMAI 2042]